MSRGRIIFYVVVLTICLLFLGIKLQQRQSKSSGERRPDLNQTSQSEPVAGDQLLLNKPGQKENPILPMLGRSSISLGRIDPFVTLPAEEFANALPENSSGGENGVSSGLPAYGVRGILLGPNPSAYVEEPNGYRKISLGDSFAGGRVVKITENSVVINRQGSQVILNLGE